MSDILTLGVKERDLTGDCRVTLGEELGEQFTTKRLGLFLALSL